MCDTESDSGRGAVDEQKLQHGQARLATTLHARRRDGPAGTRRPRRGAAAIAALLVAVGGALIISTYTEFSETVDEPVHIAAGMQWLDRGTYVYQPANPPLARIASALLPFLAGQRSQGLPDPVAEGNALLYADDQYLRNLSRYRLGILVFFLLASVTLWIWACRVYGKAVALAAILLFASLPPVLGHAGLATTDAAIMATLALTAFLFARWLEEPTLPLGAGLGAALGLSVLSKFSALVFVPGAAMAILGVRLVVHNGDPPRPMRTRIVSLGVGALVALALLWAGYRFAWGPIRLGGTPVPAPALLLGLSNLTDIASGGHPAFLLGRQSQTGWWYYFPVALLVKTPLPTLVLGLIGAASIVAIAKKARDWRFLAPPAAAAAVLVMALPSKLDLGIRYILPIYPLLAITAGVGLKRLWASPGLRMPGRVTAILLVSWQLWSGARNYPDYVAYFNELAARHPERVLLDSNLDWGQDLLRLSRELHRRKATSVAICYFGNADIRRHGLPNPRRLVPNQWTSGWVAVSEMCLLDPSYSWLKAERPVGRVGRSIRLYNLPD